jgi:hypothetical protein
MTFFYLGLSRRLRSNENRRWILRLRPLKNCNHSWKFDSSPRKGKVYICMTNGSKILIYLTLLNFIFYCTLVSNAKGNLALVFLYNFFWVSLDSEENSDFFWFTNSMKYFSEHSAFFLWFASREKNVQKYLREHGCLIDTCVYACSYAFRIEVENTHIFIRKLCMYLVNSKQAWFCSIPCIMHIKILEIKLLV